MSLESLIESALEREYNDDHLNAEERHALVEAYRKENHWLPIPADVAEAYQWIIQREG